MSPLWRALAIARVSRLSPSSPYRNLPTYRDAPAILISQHPKKGMRRGFHSADP
jgi:hypothetical protein